MERKPHPESGKRGPRASVSDRSRSASHRGASPATRSHYSTPPRRPYAQGGSHADSRDGVRRASRAEFYDRPPVRRRKPRRRIHPAALLILLGLLALLVYLGTVWITVARNADSYCDNITINGVDMTAYSHEGGVQTLDAEMESNLSAQYSFEYQGQSWSFSALDFGVSTDLDSLLERAWNIGHVGGLFDRYNAIRDLKQNPISFSLQIDFDESRIDAFIESIYAAVYVAPIDAQIIIDTDSPHLASPSSNGQELDREAMRSQIMALILGGSASTQLPIVTVAPALSSDDATGGFQVIVEYKTDTTFRGWAGRTNVRKALSYFSGMCVHDGETISFNAVVGPRTAERGFQKATEYAAGGTTQEGYGGGVCQASSTLYGAMLLSGMDIIQRSRHSMTVSYVEPSLDAAVTDDSKDLVFQNNTGHPIYIYTSVTKEFATVTVYGNRPAYQYQLYSNIVSQDAECTNVSYIPDEDAKYCYYTTETYPHSSGHPACSSEGWLIAYDWDSGEEVSRKQLSYDKYRSGTNVYWRGIHDVNEVVAPTN